MPTRIFWTPPTPAADFYEVRVAASTGATFLLSGVVTDQRPGPNWSVTSHQFFYDDPTGTDASVYRVQGFLSGGLVFDSGVFQPQVSTAAQIATRVKVDHNYQLADQFRYLSPGGAGIPQALIRVFQKPDWDAGRRNVGLFVTETLDDGRWQSPFWLEPGLQYVLTFEKSGSFGPDIVEILV